MNLNIKDRCQKIFECIHEKAHQSICTIASVTGIPKSSVGRHLRVIKKRTQHPESYFWETEEGGEWLRLLVFAVIYDFGVKGVSNVNYVVRSRQLHCPVISRENQATLLGIGAHRNEEQ
jgi:DNA-binding transcriptional ArsR family regulator